MATDTQATNPETLTEALLGTEVLSIGPIKRVMGWPAELRAALISSLLATTVLVPYLGSVGLWDPWETHYGEVAREMIQRNDYVHPYWENAWFFSKPAFTMWMQATGMQAADMGPLAALFFGILLAAGGYALWSGTFKQLGKTAYTEFWAVTLGWVGLLFTGMGIAGKALTLSYKFANAAGGDGAMPLFTEWGFRLPFTGFSILAVTMLSYAMSRTVSARAALATSVALLSMPLYFLLSRQAVTDTPIISATICGMSCSMIGLFDKATKRRSEWWYGAYVFFAIATLAKGLLGFGIPMVVAIAYLALCVAPGTAKGLNAHVQWAIKHATMPLMNGLGAGLVVGVIAAYIGGSRGTMFMSGPPGADGKDLITAAGWLGIMWGSLAFWAVSTVMLGRVKVVSSEPPPVFALMYDMRLGTGLLLFLAVCLPWYYEMFTFWRVDDESKIFWFRFIVHDHFARLGSGVHTTTPGGDFTYFIQQGGYAMYPWVAAIPGAISILTRVKIRGGTSLDGVSIVAVLWFAITWALIGASATKFHHYVFPMLPPMAILMGIFIDKVWTEGLEAHALTLLFGAPLMLLVGKDLAANPKDFTDLFVYNYDRPYPEFLTTAPVLGSKTIRDLMAYGFALAGALLIMFGLMRAKVSFFATALTAALVWSLWFNWSHWVNLSHHWTQRDQFWRYFSQRRPGEPIAAFLMNWRGETFYSRNTVKQIKDNANVGMAAYAAQPGRKWSLVEHNRLGILKGAVGADKVVTTIDKDLNNKFVLVTIE